MAGASSARRPDGRVHAHPYPPHHLCRHVRPHDRRPGAAGRYRPHHRGGARPHHLWRGGEVRRRQGDPRRDGPVPGDARGGRGGYRHHQRADRGSLGHLQGRCGPARRAHRGHRQGGQSRHAARRRHRHRAGDGGHRGRGAHPDGGRVRRPYPLHLSPADRRRAPFRGHDHAGRWHRAGPWHACHDLHPRCVAYRAHVAGRGWAPGQYRAELQGQRLPPRGAGRDGGGRGLRHEAARGLGHDARRHRLLPPWPTTWTCR
jgi:hypothetical protein